MSLEFQLADKKLSKVKFIVNAVYKLAASHPALQPPLVVVMRNAAGDRGDFEWRCPLAEGEQVRMWLDGFENELVENWRKPETVQGDFWGNCIFILIMHNFISGQNRPPWKKKSAVEWPSHSQWSLMKPSTAKHTLKCIIALLLAACENKRSSHRQTLNKAVKGIYVFSSLSSVLFLMAEKSYTVTDTDWTCKPHAGSSQQEVWFEPAVRQLYFSYCMFCCSVYHRCCLYFLFFCFKVTASPTLV